jgi:hypothetical protein
MKPFNLVFDTVSKAVTRDRSGPLLNFGLDLGIDLLFRKFLLARAGWLTKVVVPFLVKNLSSHIIIDRQKYLLLKKIRRVFNKAKKESVSGPDSESAVNTDVLS